MRASERISNETLGALNQQSLENRRRVGAAVSIVGLDQTAQKIAISLSAPLCIWQIEETVEEEEASKYGDAWKGAPCL